MSTYDVDYSQMTGVTKWLKALQDCVDYIGEDKFNEIHEQLIQDCKAAKKPIPIMAFAFAGVQGYPAYAWQRLIALEAGLSVGKYTRE